MQNLTRSAYPLLIAAVVAIVLIVGTHAWVNRDSDANKTIAASTASSDLDHRDAGGEHHESHGNATRRENPACKEGAHPVLVTIVMSPDNAELVEQLATDYMRTGPQVEGRCTDLRIVVKSSGEAMAALAQEWDERTDGPRPDVWSPASSRWITLLQQRTAATDRRNLVPSGTQNFAVSPLVIAMPKPMAEALGWPRKQLGWAEVLNLTRAPAGWGKYDHPEWGAFKLGKTNPNFSTSGMDATIGAYFAATGRITDLTTNDIADPKVREFITNVERSVVHYGDTTLTFLAQLQRADDIGLGLSYISAVTVQEKSVWDYNQGNPTGNPKTLGQRSKPRVPLAAIYPKEGTLLSDYPYMILTASWVDDAKRKAAVSFLDYLRGDAAQRKFEQSAFRSYKNTAGPLIIEANGLLPDEPATLLSSLAPDVLDALLKSWADVRKPANVLLVIDVSGSMGRTAEGTGESKITLAQRAASHALDLFAAKDRVGLWIFSTELDGKKDYQELVPIGPVGEEDRWTHLRSKIASLVPRQGTGMYDTTKAAYETIMQRFDPGGINAVVLLTDGRNEDPASIPFDRLIAAIKVEPGSHVVRIFTIAFGADADQQVLKKIAEVSNGAFYDASEPDRIEKVFTDVISNF